MLYQHLPTEVEAMQWDGNYNTYEKIYAWAKGDVKLNTVSSVITIQTNGLVVTIGDYIIINHEGEIYPCPDSTFQSSYQIIK